MKLFEKVLIIFTIFVVTFTALVVRPNADIKRADAWFAPALPAVGTGAYIVGALAVGGFLAGLGIDKGDEIHEHAGQVWDNLKADTKAALNSAYKVINKLIPGVGYTDVYELDTSNLVLKRDDVAADLAASARLAASVAAAKHDYFNPFEVPAGFVTSYPEFIKTNSSSSVVFDFNNVGKDHVFMIYQEGVQRFYETISFTSYWVSSRVQSTAWSFGNSLGYYGANGYDRSSNWIYSGVAGVKTVDWVKSNVHYIEQLLNDQRSVFGAGVTITIVPRADVLERTADQDQVQDIGKTKQAVEGVGSATLPISTVIDLNPDLTYDGDTGFFRDQTGAVANPVVPAPKVINGKVTVPVNENINVDVRDGTVVTTPVNTAPPAAGEGAYEGVSGGYFSQFWSWLVGILEAIRDGVLSLAAMVTAIPLVEGISSALDSVASWTDTFFASAAATLSDGLSNLDTFANEFWGSFTDSLALGLTGITDFTTTYWDSYTDSFARGLEGIGIDSISKGIDNIGTWTGEFWDSYTDSFAAGLSGIDTFVTEFWGSFTGAMSGALSGINTFIKDFGSIIAGLFIPTLALGTWWTAVNESFNKRFILPEIDDFMGFTDLACIGVQDMYAEIFGKRVKVFEGSYLIEYSYWWKNIASGLMWFLAIWFVWRKVIGLFNRTGGATP